MARILDLGVVSKKFLNSGHNAMFAYVSRERQYTDSIFKQSSESKKQHHANLLQYVFALRNKHALQLPIGPPVGTAIKLYLNQFFGYLYSVFWDIFYSLSYIAEIIAPMAIKSIFSYVSIYYFVIVAGANIGYNTGGRGNKPKDENMEKKKNEFWENHKIELIPLIACAGILVALAGVWRWNHITSERKTAEKVAAARAALDSANMTKDTIALSAAKDLQK